MDIKLLKQKLSDLKGDNWQMMWEQKKPINDIKNYDFYIKDWNEEEEKKIFIKNVSESQEDYADELKDIISILREMGLRIDSFRAYNLKQVLEKWDIEDSTMRKLLRTGVGVEGVDFIKLVNGWVVSEDSEEFFRSKIKTRAKKKH